MSAPLYDVVGIGNAMMDILIPIDDQFLDKENLKKGGMSLVDLPYAENLLEKALIYLRSTKNTLQQRSGGSAANTLAGIASLEGKGAYLGRINKDPLGSLFKEDMKLLGIKAPLPERPASNQTGRCLVFITPDSQRTMRTYLGAANDFCMEDLMPEIVQKSKILYLEGYLWDPPHAQEAFIQAAIIAHTYHRQVALSLSDALCVDRHRESLKTFIAQYVDVVFGNESEILSLTQENSLESIFPILDTYKNTLFAITLGENGSFIYKNKKLIKISPIETSVVDTTGAGDLYASGFLFGLARNLSLEACGYLASQCASHIISCLGGRPECSLKSLFGI